MPKKNIPTDQQTLDMLAAVPADAVFERLNGLLEAAEVAEQHVAELREQVKQAEQELEKAESAGADAAEIAQLRRAARKPIPRRLREQALEAGHLRRLIEQVRDDTPENRKKLSQAALATKLTSDNARIAKAARVKRDRAGHVLHVRHGVRKVDLYGKYDIGRGKLNAAFRTFSGNVPDMPKDAAWAEADKQHRIYAKAISVEATARPVRDDLFAELERPTAPHLGDTAQEAGYTPTDLGRIVDLTGARITQIRTGSSNRARAERARQLREAREREALEKIGA